MKDDEWLCHIKPGRLWELEGLWNGNVFLTWGSTTWLWESQVKFNHDKIKQWIEWITVLSWFTMDDRHRYILNSKYWSYEWCHVIMTDDDDNIIHADRSHSQFLVPIHCTCDIVTSPDSWCRDSQLSTSYRKSKNYYSCQPTQSPTWLTDNWNWTLLSVQLWQSKSSPAATQLSA